MHGKAIMFAFTIGFASSVCVAHTPAGNANPATATLSVDMGEGCSIRVKDLFKGHLASGIPLNASYWTDVPPVKTSVEDFHVAFQCFHKRDQSMADLAHQHGGTYDTEKRQWVAYYGNDKDREDLSSVTHVHSIDSIDGSGFYLIQDDTDGDEDRRNRYFSYCLFHKALALCGGFQVMRLTEPKGNLLPYVLDILRTVEFVDPPAPAP